MTNNILKGKITASTEQAIANVGIRLIGTLEQLGAHSQATISHADSIQWTHEISGFSSHRWNAYTKYVAQNVAGISFAEFSQLVVEHNPSLAKSDYMFQPEQRYRFPENREINASIVWNRPLTNFSGNRWQCWKRYIQGKVIGLSWKDFKEQILKHNPTLATQDYIFQENELYQLPHMLEHDTYELFIVPTKKGRYKFEEVPPGTYRIQVVSFSYQRYEKTITIDSNTTLDIVLISAFVAAQQQVPSGFIHAQGGRFVLNGQPFRRFIGVNIPRLHHIGDKSILEHTGDEDQSHKIKKEYLRKAQEIGTRVVRIFLPHHSCTNQLIIQRLQVVLELMNEFDMYVIPAFIDQYNNTGSSPSGTNQPGSDQYVFHDFQDGDHHVRLSNAFYAEKYKGLYHQFVKEVVEKFTLHPRIFCWEIGNEIKAESGQQGNKNGHPDTLVSFCLDTARCIKQWDQGRHMVTTGLLSTQHAWMKDQDMLIERLYRDAPEIDYITVHSYYENMPDREANYAHRFGKPLVVEESGIPDKETENPMFAGNHDEFRAKLALDTNRWLEQTTIENLPGASNFPERFKDDKSRGKPRQRAAGYMPWNFDPVNKGLGSGGLWKAHDVMTSVLGGWADQFRHE